jgi:hypothetical protein
MDYGVIVADASFGGLAPPMLWLASKCYWLTFNPTAVAPTMGEVEIMQRFSQRTRHRLAT